MSYYGYPIDPKQLEREKRKEREKREKEREASFIENKTMEDSSINTNRKIEEDNEEEDEYIEVDCSWCTQAPENCDKNCLEHLKEEYLATLLGDSSSKDIENEEELDTVDEEKNLLNELEKKTFCLEPGLLEKLKKDLEEEDYLFVKKDMIFYTIIFFATFITGLLLFSLGAKYNVKIVLSLSVLILLSQNIANLCWKGCYWNHIKVRLNSRKHPTSYETIVKEIPKYRANALKVPIYKRYIVTYSFAIFVSIVILIM